MSLVMDWSAVGGVHALQAAVRTPPPPNKSNKHTHRAASGSEAAKRVDRAPWKWAVRQRIWELLEKRDLAAPPRPVYHRMWVLAVVVHGAWR